MNNPSHYQPGRRGERSTAILQLPRDALIAEIGVNGGMGPHTRRKSEPASPLLSNPISGFWAAASPWLDTLHCFALGMTRARPGSNSN